MKFRISRTVIFQFIRLNSLLFINSEYGSIKSDDQKPENNQQLFGNQ